MLEFDDDIMMPSATLSTIARAPAKINLALAVRGRRPDGYHEIASLVMGVEVYDDLDFTVGPPGGIRLECSGPTVPGGEGNLVVRAAKLLARRAAITPSLGIRLQKRIPVGAGLGGGSSDAAATLSTLNRLWSVGMDPAALAAMGAELGSDVPLFFALPTSWVTGRGDRVRAVRVMWTGWVVLIDPSVNVATAEVYRAWCPGDAGPVTRSGWRRICAARSAADVAAMMYNDLEPALFRLRPELAALHRRIREKVGPTVRVSGSGAVMFVVADEEGEAMRMADAAEHACPGVRCRVVRTLTRPAANAEGGTDGDFRGTGQAGWQLQRPAEGILQHHH